MNEPKKNPKTSKWKVGPLPAKTFGWGAVQLIDDGQGMHFADFCGDYVLTGDHRVKRLAPEVKWWNNSLTLPPDEVI